MVARSGFAALLVLAALPAYAQDEDSVDQTIVVTGTPLTKTEADLKNCLARKCPPKEDIDASLAHAENLFVAGDYGRSRETLAAARGRNARYAKQFPVEVADLTRAYSRVSEHDGYPDLARVLQFDTLDALKAGLEQGDSRVLMQRLMVGDQFGKQGRFRAAADVYRKVARQGREAGKPMVTGFAMLREAVLYAAVSYRNSAYRAPTEQRIKAIEQTGGAEFEEFRFAARMLRARLAADRGDSAELDAAIAAFKDQKLDRPVLVFAPPLRLDRVSGHEDGRIPAPNNVNKSPEWIDVRFRIAADGTVKDIETVREAPTVHGVWPKAVRANLAERRYAPLALADGSDGMTRIERFTLAYDVYRPTGSRLRQRATAGRVRSIDLTDDAPRIASNQAPATNP